eukprot:CAMPEP_0168329442 /NCGR_PEP_ID=MMETSP0213-20121227/7112_1 /TAXON_ID=151035 /ORGANISM="Euplotes harpa, Strain FSP1.4" /LENGTH=69 /DNA_ID=CAMNT_0008332771 /DNA_START=129 /DNA_END=335 /DNA_ORIENTATION=+
MIAKFEGKRNCVYKDQLGIQSIGIGFNLMRAGAKDLFKKFGIDYDAVLSGEKCLSDGQIMQLFENDVAW